jgi:predicted protein tyrosine phosphatase
LAALCCSGAASIINVITRQAPDLLLLSNIFVLALEALNTNAKLSFGSNRIPSTFPHYLPSVNILFVCSRNNWRSPTAETIYKRKQGYHVRSAGTEPSARVRISSRDILWADMIFVMEKKHKHRLVDRFPDDLSNKTVIVLDIEDEYEYMDEELVEMIKRSVDPHLT